MSSNLNIALKKVEALYQDESIEIDVDDVSIYIEAIDLLMDKYPERSYAVEPFGPSQVYVSYKSY
jgi:hypothetical protein